MASGYIVGSSKTLSRAMLADLHRGMAHLSLLPYNNTTGVIFSGLDFSGADEIYTIKDSFNLAKADPTTTEIKIDQLDATIDSDVEAGEYTMTGNIPSVAAAVLNAFGKEGVAISTNVPGQEGTNYQGKSFFDTAVDVYATVLLESASMNTAICFARVKLNVFPPSQDDNSNPAYFKFTGTILSNTESTGLQGDFALLEKQ